MIDHTGFAVADLETSKRFYTAALRSLGIALLAEVTPQQSGTGSHAGYGSDDKPFFWIGDEGPPPKKLHVAFAAPSRAAVDAFYQAGVQAGGADNGAPGIRAHFHPNYYAAFVLDPDGVNIEAVCHRPQ
jgi:catechol 2,3-dioxygenase-like lactoylglutathione lyase family enzyme